MTNYNKEIILTADPLEALLLIQKNHPNSTFIIGDDNKYIEYFQTHNIIKTVFTFDGKARLFYELTRLGVSSKRVVIDFDKLKETKNNDSLSKLFEDNTNEESEANTDLIRVIENGFLFQFPHLSYRVIGNFNEYTLHLKANIKTFRDDEIFVDAIDLYKNRDRQNYIFNIMDKFNIRDQVLLERDMTQIIDVIENHKEKKENEKKKVKPELTDYQKDIGTRFLTNQNLITELENDITTLGYVREKKNKILMYLLMTSRLTENPLHSVVISRSGAGKSHLVDIVESLCPPEELESVSDLSAQALYYYGQDDLKNKFIVIGEKEGSKDSEYPLRELISKKTITKAIPMKDQITGQIKTVSIKVNGPIALAETTTSSDINPENLNRCFVLSVDESEDQTKLIHEKQREARTLEGILLKRKLSKIKEKHIYAQRLLEKTNVLNPFAPFLTFPTARLQTRRDNEKLLKLIDVICFLRQYQRKTKKLKLENNEYFEYIECTIDDYKVAYDLLIDGILDNTLDDLPRTARELFEIIKKYLNQKVDESTSLDKIIFTAKEIREYSSWSYGQVRNAFNTLRDYEYIQVVKSKNGFANQYKLTPNYSDNDFINTICSPEEVEKRIKEKVTTK